MFGRDGQSLCSVEFEPDEQTGSSSQTIRLWDLRSRRVMQELAWVPKIHEKTLSSQYHSLASAYCISEDGAVVAAAGGWMFHGSQLSVWDVRTGSRRDFVTLHEFAFDRLEISPDGRWVAAGHAAGPVIGGGTFRLFDLTSPSDAPVMQSSHPEAAFSSDSRWLAMDSDLWNLKSPRPVKGSRLPWAFSFISRYRSAPRSRHLAGINDLNGVAVWDADPDSPRLLFAKKLFCLPRS